ncbi:hypothetical protein B0H14DRAFT_1470857 [Mycena olivaceomarginata]|nr:hypothetical protein B0H14DRAFT_1470857 [Mycena olivaceomarginata]
MFTLCFQLLLLTHRVQFCQECSNRVSLVQEASTTTSGTLCAVSAACRTFRVVIPRLHRAARPAYELGSAAIAALPRRFHSASQQSQGPAWMLSLLARPLQLLLSLLFAGGSPWPAGRATPCRICCYSHPLPVQPQHTRFRRGCPLVGHFCGSSFTCVAAARALCRPVTNCAAGQCNACAISPTAVACAHARSLSSCSWVKTHPTLSRLAAQFTIH